MTVKHDLYHYPYYTNIRNKKQNTLLSFLPLFRRLGVHEDHTQKKSERTADCNCYFPTPHHQSHKCADDNTQTDTKSGYLSLRTGITHTFILNPFQNSCQEGKFQGSAKIGSGRDLYTNIPLFLSDFSSLFQELSVSPAYLKFY